jgi:hypothetical protein
MRGDFNFGNFDFSTSAHPQKIHKRDKQNHENSVIVHSAVTSPPTNRCHICLPFMHLISLFFIFTSKYSYAAGLLTSKGNMRLTSCESTESCPE